MLPGSALSQSGAVPLTRNRPPPALTFPAITKKPRHSFQKRQRWPGTLPGPPSRVEPLALQAPTATAEEAAIAELLLSEVMVPVDHLVEELASGAPRRAVNEVAFVTDLEATGVEPARDCVRVGDRLRRFVARRVDHGVAVEISVRRLDDAWEVDVGTAGKASPRQVDREGQVRVHDAVRSEIVVSAEGRARLEVDRAGVPLVSRRTCVEARLDVLGQVQL